MYLIKISSSLGGHLDDLCFLAVVNSTAVNMGQRISYQQVDFFFFYIHDNTCYLCLFGSSHSYWCELITHCGFDFLFLVINDVEDFFMYLLASYFPWEMYIGLLSLFKLEYLGKGFCYFVCNWVVWVCYVFWMSTSCLRGIICKYFLIVSPLWCFLCFAKALLVWWNPVYLFLILFSVPLGSDMEKCLPVPNVLKYSSYVFFYFKILALTVSWSWIQFELIIMERKVCM